MASRVPRLRLRLRPLLFLLGARSFLACCAEHATEEDAGDSSSSAGGVEDKSGTATMKAMLEQHTALRRLMMKAGDIIDPAVREKVLALEKQMEAFGIAVEPHTKPDGRILKWLKAHAAQIGLPFAVLVGPGLRRLGTKWREKRQKAEEAAEAAVEDAERRGEKKTSGAKAEEKKDM
mmetsp:Transcript_99733/g.260619  ORF Transcript_99733/g.260619 Transcript_99733/m.260619 type:complete len:177 (+) Transcript_99733:16-546(+)